MKAHILDVDALRALKPASLSAYARAEGWSKEGSYGDKADIYTRAGEPELVIPRHTRLGDYPSLVLHVIKGLSGSLGFDQISIYRNLSCADQDVVRVRATEHVDDGAIDLDVGVKLVSQARDMLLSAACAVRSPQAVFRAGANKDAAEYMRSVQLGQTEHGSFVITLLSPVPPPLQLDLEPNWAPIEAEPMARAVTRRLMSALAKARSASELASSGEAEAFDRAVSHGVSANLCEAVATLIEAADGIDIRTTWARTRPAPTADERVVFTASDAIALKEAARVFRMREPKRDFLIFGPITKLARGELADKGLVTIKALVDETLQSVTVELEDELYRKAVAAHRDRTPIFLKGDLERLKSRWQLVRPSLEAEPEGGAEIEDTL